MDSTCGFKDLLLVGIPNVNGDGFSKAMVKLEYEWKPPHCTHCKIFGHKDISCPRQVKVVADTSKQDDFIPVVRKKAKNKGKQIEGERMTKPKPNFVYRPKQSGSSAQGELHSKSHVGIKNLAPSQQPKTVTSSGIGTSNSFAALDGEDEDSSDVKNDEKNDGNGKFKTQHDQRKSNVTDLESYDEVETIFDENEDLLRQKTGTSTPAQSVPNV